MQLVVRGVRRPAQPWWRSRIWSATWCGPADVAGIIAVLTKNACDEGVFRRFLLINEKKRVKAMWWQVQGVTLKVFVCGSTRSSRTVLEEEEKLTDVDGELAHEELRRKGGAGGVDDR